MINKKIKAEQIVDLFGSLCLIGTQPCLFKFFITDLFSAGESQRVKLTQRLSLKEAYKII